MIPEIGILSEGSFSQQRPEREKERVEMRMFMWIPIFFHLHTFDE